MRLEQVKDIGTLKNKKDKLKQQRIKSRTYKNNYIMIQMLRQEKCVLI